MLAKHVTSKHINRSTHHVNSRKSTTWSQWPDASTYEDLRSVSHVVSVCITHCIRGEAVMRPFDGLT
jgi:hypothetical protein